MIIYEGMLKVLRGSRRFLFLTFPFIFLTACGSADVSVESESQTKSQTKLQTKSQTRNSGVSMNLSQKISLEEMESEIFNTFGSYQNCAYQDSRFADDAQRLVGMFNNVLSEMELSDSSISGAELRSFPPREDDKLAVYLCGDLLSDAYTLYRSVFLSNPFIEELWEAAQEDDKENLFESALGFVLYHELGHTILNHSAIKLENSDNSEFTEDEKSSAKNFDLLQELEADQFAYNVILLVGLNVEGSNLARQAGPL